MNRYDFDYSPDSRADRLTALGRVAVVACSLLAVVLADSQPPGYANIVLGAVTFYLFYALGLYLAVRRSDGLLDRQRLLTHGIDIAAFSIFIYFTAGTDSPFILGFVFAVACATLRWQWRGAVWTGATVIILWVALGIDSARVLPHATLDPNRLVVRTTFLVVLSVAFAYLGAYQSHVRAEMQKLAVWPSVGGRDLVAAAREILPHAADVMRAPRALMIWEEPEEPGPRLASWANGQFNVVRERPGVLEPLVAAVLAESDFLCRDVQARHPEVLHAVLGGQRRWHGVPLHAELVQRFQIHSVLCARLQNLGYLIFLDKPGMTAEALRIARIVAHQVMSSLEHVRLLQSLEEAAVAGERVRLAHDLHDGVLQSLTAIALQVEAIVRGIETAPQQRLEQIQGRIVDEQRRLRYFIEGLKSPTQAVFEDDSSLTTRLEALARRLESDWGVQVKLNAAGADRIQSPIAHGVFFIVHEALINAARHARASTVEADLTVGDGRVEITVADNGHGFPFRGRYTGAALKRRRLGPATLHARVLSFDGTLIVESTDQGSRLEIALPLPGSVR